MADTSGKFQLLVRLGYLARAIMYTVIGLVALTSVGKIQQGTNSIFRAVEDFPAGSAIIWLLVIGLAGYGLFRLSSALFDIEHEGSDKTGLIKRAGHAGSAIGHFALAWSALQFARSGHTDDNGAQEAASGVLSMPMGDILLGLLGIAFFAAAVNQAKKAWDASFMHRIDSRAPGMTCWLGRIGFAARAIVFTVIGWSLVRSGWFESSDEVKTLGKAVASLSDNGAWFTVVAVGLLIFGIFSLVLARYRIIPNMDISGKMPEFRRKAH